MQLSLTAWYDRSLKTHNSAVTTRNTPSESDQKSVSILAQRGNNWMSNVPNTGLSSVYDSFQKLKLTKNLSARSLKTRENRT